MTRKYQVSSLSKKEIWYKKKLKLAEKTLNKEKELSLEGKHSEIFCGQVIIKLFSVQRFGKTRCSCTEEINWGKIDEE